MYLHRVVIGAGSKSPGGPPVGRQPDVYIADILNVIGKFDVEDITVTGTQVPTLGEIREAWDITFKSETTGDVGKYLQASVDGSKVFFHDSILMSPQAADGGLEDSPLSTEGGKPSEKEG